MSEWITLDEFAQRMAMKKATVKYRCQNGKYKAMKTEETGGKWYVHRDHLAPGQVHPTPMYTDPVGASLAVKNAPVVVHSGSMFASVPPHPILVELLSEVKRLHERLDKIEAPRPKRSAKTRRTPDSRYVPVPDGFIDLLDKHPRSMNSLAKEADVQASLLTKIRKGTRKSMDPGGLERLLTALEVGE